MNKEIDIENFAPWLFIITLAGGILRVLLLGTKSMWLDETFSVWLASHSIADMLQWTVKIDQHPPLYYLLLHFWIGFKGTGAYYVRLLSVLLGVATIPIVFLIGKRLSGTLVGLAAAMLLAFSPYHIYYAQETRMYTLLTFNASVAIYALARLLTDPCSARPIGSQVREYVHAWRTAPPVKPGRGEEFSYRYVVSDQKGWWGWVARHRWLPIQSVQTDLAWLAFILFTAATMLTHNTALLFPVAANVFVLGLIMARRGKASEDEASFHAPSFSNWAKAQAAILLLWLPWLVPFIKQATGVLHRFWIPQPTWGSALQVVKSYLYVSGPVPDYIITIIWIVYALALGLALLYYRGKLPQFLFLAALFAVPFLGELLVSIWRPVFYDRTLIWISVPLYLVVAAGLTRIKIRPLIFVVLGVLATVNMFSTGDYLRFYQKEDWNTAARAVAGFAQKDDLILFNSNAVEIPFNYYFKPYETYYYMQVEKRGLPLDLINDGALEPEMTSKDVPGLIALLKGHNRVWLVYSHNSYTDPQGIIPKTLASQMKLTRTEDFYGGQVLVYTNP